jgi:Domain of unknown function (DUF4177)
MKNYRVAIFQEKWILTLLTGSGKIDPVKFAEFLNIHASEWFRVVTIEREVRRAFLIFRREAMVCVLEKDIA